MSKYNLFKIKKYKKFVVISFSENNIKADDIYYDLNLLVDDINFDDSIWAVAFDFSNGLNIQNASDNKFILSLTELVMNIKKPTFCAINGEIINRAFEFILPMDYRICSRTSTFVMNQILDPNIQFDGATQLLPRIIGLNKAKEMIMLGVDMNSEDAFNFGLVNLVTSEDKLMNIIVEKLLKIVSFSPLAMQYTKEAINFGNETPTVEGMKMENDLSSILLSSKDRIQAINSFKNKKSKKDFKGK
tara:strand:- start:3475 stop:4209 length:735 start_codon:yes stop_codon:yes gene_type:complete